MKTFILAGIFMAPSSIYYSIRYSGHRPSHTHRSTDAADHVTKKIQKDVKDMTIPTAIRSDPPPGTDPEAAQVSSSGLAHPYAEAAIPPIPDNDQGPRVKTSVKKGGPRSPPPENAYKPRGPPSRPIRPRGRWRP